jgi:hypothetical protein
MTLARARAKLRSRGLAAHAPAGALDTSRVVAQWPKPRVAAAPRLKVSLALKGA